MTQSLFIAGRALRTRLGVRMQKLAILRHNVYRLLAWPLIAAFSAGLLWSATLSWLSEAKEHVRANAFNEAASLSKIYAQQLARSLEQIDYITLHAKYEWEQSASTANFEKQARAKLYPGSGQVYVTIADRHGRRVASTLAGGLEGPSLADRPYFQRHQNDPSAGLLINAPILGHRTGKLLIRFSRRVDAPDGSFNGLVIVSVEPAYFASFVDESSLNKNAHHAVRRSDGVLLGAKTGQGTGSLNDGFQSPSVFESNAGVVRMPAQKFSRDQVRIIAWQKLGNYPVVAIVSLSEQEIFASYQVMERNYQRIAIAGSLFLLLLTITGIFFSARLAIKKQHAEEVKHAYRVATDGAREGFYMVRPLYEQGKGVVDFVIEDCNEWGASYYGTTRTELIGAKFSTFWPDAYARKVTEMCRRAMDNGFYEDEFRTPSESPLRVPWIHRRLIRSGEGLAVTLRDISEMKAHEETLWHLANADAVTTLPNRHWLMNYLPAAVERARHGNTRLALLFVDLDDFKNVNDTLGHAAGDQLLRAVAARLQTVIRPQDSIVRLGGDEFTVILEHIDNTDDVSGVAERIIDSLGDAFILQDESKHLVRASIGISIFPHDGGDWEVLLKHADVAMYAAKANGKGRYQVYQRHFSERLVTRLNQEQALRRAIERDEFILYYQPRLDTRSGELLGMEALVRWMTPEHTIVPPQEFIPIAEDTGLIVPLGAMVMEKACAQLAQWNAQHLPVVPVSINVSPRQFSHGNVGADLASCMEKYRIDASLIEIEITESCMVGEDDTVSEQLAAIKALGVKLLVDDFGTGYSSLSQLKRLAVNGLKVDRSFTAQLGNGKEDEAFFSAIISMAHAIGMSVVAEGVETTAQLRILQALSCDEIQGYLISQPVPADEIPALIRMGILSSRFATLSAALPTPADANHMEPV